jgi:hypothetical protein
MKRGRAYIGVLVPLRFRWSQARKSEGRNPKPERRPKPEARNQQPACEHVIRFTSHAVAWQLLAPEVPHSKVGARSPRISDFGLLLSLGLRVSGFARPTLARWKRRSSGLLPRSLLLLLVSALVCFGQRQNEPRPAPLDPVQAEKEARALVAELLAQKPEQNTTNTGRARIRDAAGKEREIPMRFEITAMPTNWVSVYETVASEGGAGGMRLTVIHSDDRPNRYQLSDPAGAGATNTVTKELAPEQTMIPFAGSDFWVADLGLEFLHWPRQRLLKKEMRHSKSCEVLESVNPVPVPGGYARVVSWIMIEKPHGIIHADAYDAQGEVFKRFDPANVEKISGEYQLEEIEMRNSKTSSHTWIKFNLADRAAVKPDRSGRGQSAQP